MTCIVGITDGTDVWLGADNSHSDNSGSEFLNKHPKIWMRGDMVMGVSGSLRIAQLLQYALECPPIKPDEDIYTYMVTTFADSMRGCLRNAGHLQVNDSVEQIGDSRILVGAKGHLFNFACDCGFVEPPESYTAIGCGAPEALGTLYALWAMPPYSTGADKWYRGILQSALECSARFNTAVRAPFHFISTRDAATAPTNDGEDGLSGEGWKYSLQERW